MGLQEEIDKTRSEIRTDGYPVSVGEWMSIYERRELDIHPEFQRFFRWSPEQKSRLIESLLLGIPIPQVFVAQRPDGIWDVVDGLQRLSTIFQFAGLLRDENDTKQDPLTLQGTKYLPSLGGKRWEDETKPKESLTAAQRLLIKRTKIGVSIILKESDDKAKYELFQRLNTGGSMLSDQEVRNSILVMMNRSFYQWIRSLSQNALFIDCIGLSDRAVEEQYDMELVLRFIVFRRMSKSQLGQVGDLGEFLTEQAKILAFDAKFDQHIEEKAFTDTFKIIANALRDDAFRRYDAQRTRFVGGFSVSAFEAVAIGIGFDPNKAALTKLLERVKAMWQNPEFVDNSGSGVRASSRVPKVIPFGRKMFIK
ncbi:DUF262 domain-containing protein [uncultured Paludibaculum sp.]|uniref:DUF262 domain-containing protein n=1 Tax=uncultured Paludibaculum sp. TaxID=1765020 RepID=UPI002AABFBDC|nr:DUF262 domain-containing protein [uncultured Paludibaculum sp.]